MIEALQKALLEMPQANVETRHLFCKGMYAREITIIKDTCLVGAKHKTEFFMVISKGSCVVRDGAEQKTLTAPCTVVSKVGAKRAIIALEDTVLTTFHATTETEVAKIEQAILEPEGFRIANSPKGVL